MSILPLRIPSKCNRIGIRLINLYSYTRGKKNLGGRRIGKWLLMPMFLVILCGVVIIIKTAFSVGKILGEYHDAKTTDYGAVIIGAGWAASNGSEEVGIEDETKNMKSVVVDDKGETIPHQAKTKKSEKGRPNHPDYFDLRLTKSTDGSIAVNCTITIPDNTQITGPPTTINQHMVHIHGFHHTGTGFTRQLLHKHLSTLHPQLSSSMHHCGDVSEDEGQHLQSVYPTAARRFVKTKKIEPPSTTGQFWRMEYQYLDSCNINPSPKKAGNLLYDQWAPYWTNASADFLIQKTPTLDVQLLETLKVLPTFHVLVLRHPMVSGRYNGILLDIYYWTEAWLHTLSTVTSRENEGMWYAVVTYEALVQYPDRVMEELMVVVKSGLVGRYGKGHLFEKSEEEASEAEDEEETNNEDNKQSDLSENSPILERARRRRLEYHSDGSSEKYLSPKERDVFHWKKCLISRSQRRCSRMLKELTLEVLPQFGYVTVAKNKNTRTTGVVGMLGHDDDDANATTAAAAAATKLSPYPGTVIVREDYGGVLFSSEGSALNRHKKQRRQNEQTKSSPDYLGGRPPVNLLSRMNKILKSLTL